MLKQFLEKYDKNNNLQFDDCRFRPSATFTTGFGLDNTFKTLRVHLGVDRGYSSKSIYDIFAPFDFENVRYVNPYGNYGALLFLPVKDFDFELRVAHLEPKDFDDALRGALLRKEKIEIRKDSFIGQAGNYGLSSGTEIVVGKKGAHTHTEIVSKDKTSLLLDSILDKKIEKNVLQRPYTEIDIERYALSVGANPKKFVDKYYQELMDRKIIFLNQYKCIRKDYDTQRERTFYNSRQLFGF